TATQTYGGIATLPVATCEPTRIYEQYRFDLVPGECSACARTTLDSRVVPTLQCLLQDTLLWQLLRCLADVKQRVDVYVQTADWPVLNAVVYGTEPGNHGAQQMHDACCNLRAAVVALYTNDPLLVRCAIPTNLAQQVCPAVRGTPVDYFNAVQPVTQ